MDARVELARRDRRREIAAWVIIAGLLALIFWGAWAWTPGSPPERAKGRVLQLHAGFQAESKYRLVRLPVVQLEISTPDGRIIQLEGDRRLLSQCRVGGEVALVRQRMNGGIFQWQLAGRPCG